MSVKLVTIGSRSPSERRSASSVDIDVSKLEKELARHISGEVRFDRASQAIYATDASNYRQVPIGVVIPKTVDDVVQTMAVCREFQAPVLSRAGGTSLAGQCCNTAVVIDWSKYLNKILELDAGSHFARVQPGTICDDVVKAARPFDLTYAPDPATHDHCCFGGMLGNNSCGAHAQMNGPAVNNVESLEILLYDGTRMNVGWLTEPEWRHRAEGSSRQAEIYAKLRSLSNRYASLVEERYPKIVRRISGYNLDQLIPDKEGRVNIARALVGSEGTCVTLLEAKVTLVYNRPERVMLVLGYPDVYQAADNMQDILEFKPMALEGIDDRLCENVEKKGGLNKENLYLLPEGKGWLIAEFGAGTEEEAKDTAERLCEKLRKKGKAPHMNLVTDKQEQKQLWGVRESGLGATAFVQGERDTWPGWEDSAVAPEQVGDYLRDLRKLFTRYGYNPALYGHFGQGCIHCRVDFDLYTKRGVDDYRSFMEEATDLIVRYKGSFSGEHGDGQSRAEFLYKTFGPELVEAFREFKSIWDPDWRMNPGKIVDPYKIDENMRLGPEYKPWDPETHFKFPDDKGSFARAALRCVGVGKCRRLEGTGEQNTMCPSFMVTREERNSTRGRSRALWEMMNGNVIQNGWRDDGVKQALDLCLACKGCKGDCPVNVDMATYKAEFLSHYWEGRVRPRTAYVFGWIDKWAELASFAPGFANLFTQLPGLSGIAKEVARVGSLRSIPAFAAETFKASFARRKRMRRGGREVVLWADTFNNYFLPETLTAACEVLESAGCEIIVPRSHLCCGRPLYDYGFLSMAKHYLQRILDSLGPKIDSGTPLVVLEPSCCAVFRDELTNLFPEDPRAQRLKEQTFSLSEFLERQEDFLPPTLKRKALVHGHCHHKAIMRMKAEESLLKKMGLDYELPASGCCGMAGSFGFEKDKYDISVDVGEHALLPAVRRAARSTLIVADGFSCREQIAQLTNRHALHTAELLALAMRNRDLDAHDYPEHEIIEPRIRAQKRSMAAAGMAIAGGIVGLGMLFAVRRRNGNRSAT